ncbi:MAG: nucleoside deaminase [Desulfobacter sp.]|nr:MAG: nucleoside deaminase [Desulfobacter sp.]
MTNDEKFMTKAIELAKQAVESGNEPFGAVLVKDEKIVFENENQIYTKTDPTFHAEAGLLHRFCQETHITDLSNYTLYSSCEPCFMCCGAMVWMKVGRLVYGASDIDLCALLGEEGSHCCETVFSKSPHKPKVTSGILREKSLKVMAEYFANHKKG